MELVDGVSLRQILARSGATTPEAALVVLQGSLLGLAAAHAAGVVHRDYKPDNVLVDGDGVSKLTDFGIAAYAGDRSARGGTLAYAPPEQFAGEPASPAGDVYAATATFFECLTGQPPFAGETAAALMYQHMAEPVPVGAVPGPLRPLIAAGMAKQPADRPADAAAFAAALSQVAAQAYGPRWYQRGRSHLAEAALLLAALWPSASAPAVQGSAVDKVILRQRHAHSRLRHASAIKKTIAAAIAVAVAGGGTYAAIALTDPSAPVTLPVVTGVSPASGGTAGGSTVRITGTGLDGATVVRFGGAPGRITADSATQITVTSPPSTSTAAIISGSGTQAAGTGAGVVDVTVTTPGGTSHHSAADRYAYTASPPAVTGVSPPSGGTAGGTTVTITGTGLAGATAVRFGAAAAAITAGSGTQITVTSPPGTGRVAITVTTPAGTSPASPGPSYSYSAQPKPAQSITFAVPGLGGDGRLGGPVGRRGRLGQSGRVHRRSGQRARGVHRVRRHRDLHRDRHLRHRRQPGRQRALRRRPPGPAHDHGHRAHPVHLPVRPGPGLCPRLGPPVGRRGRLGQPGRADRRRRVHPIRHHRDLHRAGQLRRRPPTRPATGTTPTHPRSAAPSRSGRDPRPSPSPLPRRALCGPRRCYRPPAAPPATRSCSPPPPPESATSPEAR